MIVPRININKVPSARFFLNALLFRLNTRNHKKAIENFQREFEAATKLPQCIPVSRGRFAIHLAVLQAIDDQRDEIILCPYTIFDVVNMVLTANGTPSFCDAAKNSLHPSWNEISSAITKKTAGVLITHYDTYNPHLPKIAMELKQRNIALIEDCSIALATDRSESLAGAFGDFSVFSFGLFKTVATPYGGALFMRNQSTRAEMLNDALERPLASLRHLEPYLTKSVFLRIVLHPFVFTLVTFPIIWVAYYLNIHWLKSLLDNDPHPIARKNIPRDWYRGPSTTQVRSWTTQLAKARDIVEHQRRIAAVYTAALPEKMLQSCFTEGLSGEKKLPNGTYNRYLIVVPKAVREAMHNHLISRGFDTSLHFYRDCSQLEVFNSWSRQLPNLAEMAQRVLVLPTHIGVSDDYALKLATELKKFLEGNPAGYYEA